MGPLWCSYRGLWRAALGILLLAALPAAATSLWHPNAPSWDAHRLTAGEVALADAIAWGENMLWVDARSRDKFETTAIPGAVLLNQDEWESLLPAFIERWTPETKIVAYCDRRGCHASKEVADRLRNEVGIDEVYVLHGGWQAWQTWHASPTQP